MDELDYVIGLGGNVGDVRAAFASVVRECATWGRVLGISPWYETEPVGPPQANFLNGALRLATVIPPLELLDRLLALEAGAGRERRERWGPRTLDLDVLWIRGRAFDSERLTVPHPRLPERAFALVPLLAVAPDAWDPRTGVRYRDCLEALGSEGVRRVPAGTVPDRDL
jgi:2-amino-4-hydroxy-6-hydroxymethyldihydropteridine diphosphokinase